MKMEEELRLRASQGDLEAQYDLAFYYYKKGDYQNTVAWFERIIVNPNHPFYRKSVNFLAELCEYGNYPNISEEENIDKAVLLYSRVCCYPENNFFARFHLSLIYCENRYLKYSPYDGKQMLEYVIDELIEDDGNDEYFKPVECLRIAYIYLRKDIIEDIRKAKEYLEKAIRRCREVEERQFMEEEAVRAWRTYEERGYGQLKI